VLGLVGGVKYPLEDFFGELDKVSDSSGLIFLGGSDEENLDNISSALVGGSSLHPRADRNSIISVFLRLFA
jgi:hypothetical protein